MAENPFRVYHLSVACQCFVIQEMSSVEELQGVVAGLASVVKQLTTNVSLVSQTVGQLAEANPTQLHGNLQGLRMPALQIPSFRRDRVVRDDISEFVEKIYGTNSNSSSGDSSFASGATM